MIAQTEVVDPVPTKSKPEPMSQVPLAPTPHVVVSPRKDARNIAMFRWSVAAVLAGHAVDSISSWRRPEANPALATSGSEFDGRALALKSAFLGGSFLIQRYAIHKNPRVYRPLAWMNFALAAGFGAAAIHNFRLH
jgi:hypothetical protein